MSLVRAHVLWFDFDGSVGAGLYGRYGVGEQSHWGPVASLASFTSSCVQLLSSNSGTPAVGYEMLVPCPPCHRLYIAAAGRGGQPASATVQHPSTVLSVHL